MAEVYTIELNQNNADRVVSNGDYHVTLAEPVLIEAGDSINLKLASIDSQKAETDTIVIPEETAMEIEFSTYEIDYKKEDKKKYNTVTDWDGPTFNYFATYSQRTIEVLNSITVEILGYHAYQVYEDPGSYPVSYEADPGSYVIDRNSWPDAGILINISYIDLDGKAQTAAFTGNNRTSKSDHRVHNGDSFWAAESASVTLTPYKPTGPIKFRTGTLIYHSVAGEWVGENFNKNVFVGSSVPGGTFPPKGPQSHSDNVPMKKTEFSIASYNTSSAGAGAIHLDKKVAVANINPGTYDPKALAVQITQDLNDSQGIQDPPSAVANQYLFPNNPLLQRTDEEAGILLRTIDFSGTDVANVEFTADNSYEYKDAGGNPIGYWLGASEFALEFGKAGNVFSLDYAHMPMYNSSTAADILKQSAAIYWTGDVASATLRYYPVRQASGIVIHSLKPESVWRDQMSLYNELITPTYTDNSGVEYYLPKTMENRITSGYLSLESLMVPPNPVAANSDRRKANIPPDATTPGAKHVYIDVTGQTNAVVGSPLGGNKTGGYYLVEILGLTRRRGGFVDNVGNNPVINAVVSRQYDSNDVITGFSDSGINYEHAGQPYMVKDLQVRILDPSTKLPVTDLGTNNSMIIEVVKPPPVPQKST